MSFNGHAHHQEDGAAHGDPEEGLRGLIPDTRLPVQRVVSEGEDVEQPVGVVLHEAVPDPVQDGEYEVDTVAHVDGDQNLVEAVSHSSSEIQCQYYYETNFCLISNA